MISPDIAHYKCFVENINYYRSLVAGCPIDLCSENPIESKTLLIIISRYPFQYVISDYVQNLLRQIPFSSLVCLKWLCDLYHENCINCYILYHNVIPKIHNLFLQSDTDKGPRIIEKKFLISKNQLKNKNIFDQNINLNIGLERGLYNLWKSKLNFCCSRDQADCAPICRKDLLECDEWFDLSLIFDCIKEFINNNPTIETVCLQWLFGLKHLDNCIDCEKSIKNTCHLVKYAWNEWKEHPSIGYSVSSNKINCYNIFRSAINLSANVPDDNECLLSGFILCLGHSNPTKIKIPNIVQNILEKIPHDTLICLKWVYGLRHSSFCKYCIWTQNALTTNCSEYRSRKINPIIKADWNF